MTPKLQKSIIFALSLIIGITLVILLGRELVNRPQPNNYTQLVEQDFTDITLSSIREAIGKPSFIHETEATTIYRYNPTNHLYPHEVFAEGDSVKFIRLQLTREQTMNTDQLTEQYGLTPHKWSLYLQEHGQIDLWVYPELGTEFVVRPRDNSIPEIRLFEPTDRQSYIRNFQARGEGTDDAF